MGTGSFQVSWISFLFLRNCISSSHLGKQLDHFFVTNPILKGKEKHREMKIILRSQTIQGIPSHMQTYSSEVVASDHLSSIVRWGNHQEHWNGAAPPLCLPSKFVIARYVVSDRSSSIFTNVFSRRLFDIMRRNTQIEFSVLEVIQQWVVSILGSRFGGQPKFLHEVGCIQLHYNWQGCKRS